MKKPVIDNVSLRKLRNRREGFQCVEIFSYAEDLASVMISDPLTCTAGEKVCSVARRMVDAGVSSALVKDDHGQLCGIFTESDILKRIVVSETTSSKTALVSQVMTPAPASLSPSDSVYRALGLLGTKGFKHLPLTEEGRPVGIVTLRQLLKLRYPEPMVLMESIFHATDAKELKTAKDSMPEIAARKLAMGVRAYDVVTMISLVNQDIQRKAFALCIEKLGQPPSGCCLFLTGSHGRRENLLGSDQDHGMIIADQQGTETQYSQYYMDLTSMFSYMLQDIGFPWCPGYVMSMNPTWRKSLPEWKTQISYWMNAQVTNLTRFLTVLFDSTPIYGDTALFDEMMGFARAELQKHHEALRMLHEEEGKHKVPTGLFGRFITEADGPHKGELDVKKSGLIFVVEAVRILALRHGLQGTSTLKRIEELVGGGFIHPDDGEYFEASYRLLLHFALSAQVEKNQLNAPINTFITPGGLSPREKDLLRHAFKSTTMLKGIISSEFGELVI